MNELEKLRKEIHKRNVTEPEKVDKNDRDHEELKRPVRRAW